MSIATKKLLRVSTDVVVAEHRFADGRECALVNHPSTESKFPGLCIMRAIRHPPVNGRQKIDMVHLDRCGLKSEYPRYILRCWEAFIGPLQGDEQAVISMEMIPADYES